MPLSSPIHRLPVLSKAIDSTVLFCSPDSALAKSVAPVFIFLTITPLFIVPKAMYVPFVAAQKICSAFSSGVRSSAYGTVLLPSKINIPSESVTKAILPFSGMTARIILFISTSVPGSSSSLLPFRMYIPCRVATMSFPLIFAE